MTIQSIIKRSVFATWLAVFFVCGCEDVTNHYTVGGSVSGLSGTVVLQNNGGNDLALAVDGSFTFSTELADGATYAVTILTQPSGQTCTVANGTGTVSGANVTNVTVTCSATTYSVGGTATGLSGTAVLQNNGGDDLELTADGSFAFGTELADGAAYEVTILTPSPGQTCTITNDSGTIDGADITNIEVACANTRKIFITSVFTGATMTGDLNGISGADDLCMNDASYPSGTYKAFIVDGVNRVACTTANCGTSGSSEHIDWVLAADTTYVRSDGETIIGTTNADGLFSFDLTNSFYDGNVTVMWTGLESDWTSSANNCSGWTSNAYGATGAIGNPLAINTQSINRSDLVGTCNTSPQSLACVEQ